MAKRIIFLIVVGIPIVVFFLYLYRFSIPFANEDDLPTIFAFINQAFPFDEQSLRLFFTPFREHVILPAKIVAYIQVIFSSCVDLRTMILLGNLCWVRVAWLLYVNTKQAGITPLYFLPVPFILFQVQFTETALWPMAVWSNMVVIWLAFESIHLLIDTKKLSHWRFAVAFICATGATFSNGNGLLSILIGLGILILQRVLVGRIVVWASFGVLFLGGYWWAKSLGVPDTTYGLQTNPIKWLMGVCLFIGGYGDFISGSFKGLAAILGVLLLLILAVINFKAIKQSQYWHSVTFKLTAFAVFVLLTAAAVALLRTEPVGVESALLGRYRHYSALMVAIGYLILLIHLQNTTTLIRWVFIGFLGFSIGVGALSYYRDWGYRYMDYQRFWADSYNMEHNNLLYLNWKSQSGLPEIYQATLAKNRLCKAELPLVNTATLCTDSLTPIILTDLEWETNSGESGRCNRVAVVKTDTLTFHLKEGEAWLWMLKNDQHTYFISATAIKTGPIQLLTKQQYFKPGFTGEIPTCFLQKGTYQLFLVNARRGGYAQVFRTDRLIESGR